MELTKVLDIINYSGRIYIIRPIIEEGKIKRNTIYTGIKKGKVFQKYNRSYTLGNIGRLDWYHTWFHRGNVDEKIDKDTVATGGNIRVFTDRESAKKALEDFEKQHAYALTESIDLEIKYLEKQIEEMNNKIKELKEKRAECFKHLTTTFSKKS